MTVKFESPSSLRIIRHNAFKHCVSLTSVVLPPSLTAIGVQAFHGCASLTSINIPPLLTSIGNHVFRGCTSLSKIDLCSSNIRRIGNSAFKGCTSLKTIEFPPCIMSIGCHSFSGCTSLISVIIPQNTTSSTTSDNFVCIGDGAFSKCTSLLNVAIHEPSTTTELDSFHDCDVLNKLDISKTHEFNGTEAISLLKMRYNFEVLPFHNTCYFDIENITQSIMEIISKDNKIYPSKTDDFGMTALHVLVCNTRVTADQIQAIQKLQPGMNHIRNILGQTPLDLYLSCRGIGQCRNNHIHFSIIDALTLGLSWGNIQCLHILGMASFSQNRTNKRRITDGNEGMHPTSSSVLELNPCLTAAVLKQCNLEVLYNLSLIHTEVLLNSSPQEYEFSKKRRCVKEN